jgi:branched-chain amino acid aminotransferase
LRFSAAVATIVHFGGRFVPPEEARVDVLDRGWLLGDGVFATMRGYDGACFRPEAHLASMAMGADALGIPLPYGPVEIAAIADEAARKTGARSAYVRVTLTRGAFAVIARPLEVPSDQSYSEGITAAVVGPRRIPPACIDPSFKTTSHAPQIIAWREVEARGHEEGIQLALDGSIASGTRSNVFLVDGRSLRTPPTSTGCRPGITRAAVLELAPRLGFEVREGSIPLSALDTVDEAFLTSSRIECLPIRLAGRSGSPETARLRAALRELVFAETAPRRSALV